VLGGLVLGEEVQGPVLATVGLILGESLGDVVLGLLVLGEVLPESSYLLRVFGKTIIRILQRFVILYSISDSFYPLMKFSFLLLEWGKE
jgi:hypothetical protein